MRGAARRYRRRWYERFGIEPPFPYWPIAIAVVIVALVLTLAALITRKLLAASDLAVWLATAGIELVLLGAVSEYAALAIHHKHHHDEGDE